MKILIMGLLAFGSITAFASQNVDSDLLEKAKKVANSLPGSSGSFQCKSKYYFDALPVSRDRSGYSFECQDSQSRALRILIKTNIETTIIKSIKISGIEGSI